MKKTRFLALVLVVAIMMMGAGYAYWSDQLVINNTITTGELNVRFSSATVESNEVGTKYITGTTGQLVGNDEPNKKALSIELKNLYPGASLNYNIVIENNGTIPAVMNGLTVVDGTAVAGKTPVDLTKFKVTGNITKPGGSIQTIPTNTTLANFTSVMGSVNDRLNPNQTLTLALNIELDPGLELDNQENTYTSQVFTINFKQHNQ